MYELKSDISQYFSSFLPWQCFSDTFDLQSHFAHVWLDSTVTKFLYYIIIINGFALYKNLSQWPSTGPVSVQQCTDKRVISRLSRIFSRNLDVILDDLIQPYKISAHVEKTIFRTMPLAGISVNTDGDDKHLCHLSRRP